METIDLIAAILVIIGGINWGLVGAANWNLVQEIAGVGIVADVIYIIVGVAALWMIYTISKPK